ncbi:MAG: MFS transporter, partial [bacterium]
MGTAGKERHMNPSSDAAPLSPLKARVMLIYSLAQIGAFILDTVLDQYTVFFYAPEEAAAAGDAAHSAARYTPILLAGAALGFGRVVDAVANPIVGYLSDRTRTRLGRRRPYIIFGTLPMIAFFVLLHRPPLHYESAWNALWFAAACGCFLFLYTLVVAPYLALLPEIAATGDDRVKLSSWQGVAGIVGLVVGGALSGEIVGKFDIFGMVLIMAAVSLLTILVTGLFIAEKPLKDDKIARVSFLGAVLPSLKNRHFLVYVFSISSFWLGFKILQASMIYVCTVILGRDKGYVGSVMGGLLAVLLLSIPFVFFLYGRFGKK